MIMKDSYHEGFCPLLCILLGNPSSLFSQSLTISLAIETVVGSADLSPIFCFIKLKIPKFNGIGPTWWAIHAHVLFDFHNT